MSRFFIDTDDEHSRLEDEEGQELSGPREARDLAIRALSDMTRSNLCESDRRTYTARVRGEDGRTLYSAELTLTGEWLVDPSTG